MTHALALALPCCLFGFSNGIVIANATVGAISSAGQHAGTGSGLTGAGQMAAGAIAGSIIVGLGGARNFQLAAAGLILMSLVSVASIAYVYRRRPARINSKPSHRLTGSLIAEQLYFPIVGDDGFPGIVVVGEDRNTIDTVRWIFCKRFFVVLAQIGTIHYHFLIGGASRANYESTHVFFEIGPNDNIAHLVVVVCPHIL